MMDSLVHHPLHRAILEEPDSDELRLMFADWFEEHGDPRGEFIRVQLELGRLDDLPLPRRCELELRQQQLLSAHRRWWNATLHQFLSATPLRGQVKNRRAAIRGWEYHRGFVEGLKVDAATMVAHHETLFQLGPLHHVRLANPEPVADSLQSATWLARLRSLDLTAAASTSVLRAVALSIHTCRLERLNLAANYLSPTDALLLANSTSLIGLKALRMTYSGEEVHRILGSSFGGVMTVLNLPPRQERVNVDWLWRRWRF